MTALWRDLIRPTIQTIADGVRALAGYTLGALIASQQRVAETEEEA